MHTISIQFKMHANLFNIFSKMELNLNKIKIYPKKKPYFINYEPPKS